MNSLSRYNLYKTGKTESIIHMNLVENKELMQTKEFIKKYKISNYFKGKFFIKRLIKKIFKYKLKTEFIWNKNFWNHIYIYKIDSIIKYNNFDNKYNLEKFISNNFDKKRLKDIYFYKDLIKNNVFVDYPLFIDDKALSLLLDNNKSDYTIYMLDGARRIIASLLNNNSKQTIYLITTDYKL